MMKRKKFKYLYIFMVILLFGSCRNDQKVVDFNVKDTSLIIKDNFLNNGGIEISIPGLMANKSIVDTVGLFKNRLLFKGDFFYLEDQGQLFVDMDSLKIISKVSSDTNEVYFVVPMYIKPDNRIDIMSFIAYFAYDLKKATTKQLNGGIWIEKGAQNIKLAEDGIQSVLLSYDVEFQRIENRFVALDSILNIDYSYRINHFLERQYIIEDEQQLEHDKKLEYAFGVYDIDSDGKDEVFVLFQSAYYCGSGGCNMLILDDDYSLISETSVTIPPITILNSVHKGYNDIMVFSDGNNRILEYDGSTYPLNPSSQPILKSENIAICIIKGEESDNIGFYK